MPTPTDPTDTPDDVGTPVIEFRNVVKSFGDQTVLNDLNFTVRQGERVTLIGPSGSGKTTILRLVMTLESLTDGFIYVGGEPLTHTTTRDGKRIPVRPKEQKQLRTKIGMVFQQFNLFPNMTVLENIIEAPVHVLGIPKKEAIERAKELLEQVGLPQKADSHPTSLSGGQQQRVAIARALAMNPEILLLDEVTSALDPEVVVEVLGILRKVAETTNVTMLIVTHEMSFARDVSHRVMMLDQGKIVESSDPETIFTNPTEERTRQFLSAVLSSGI